MSNAVAVQNQPAKTIQDMLVAHKRQIEMALPKHMDADRLSRIAMTCIRMNPRLMQCDPLSLFAAVIQSAQLGLEPGLLGQAYLIPYGREAQFQVGYKGLVKLARNSGQVQSFTCEVVHEKDEFEFEHGLDEKLRHKPCLDQDRGPAIAAYALAKFKDGSHQYLVMPIHEINKIRDEKSQTFKNSKSGPWVTDYEEMVKKTVAKRLCKWLDLSPELSRAVAIDNTSDSGISQQLDIEVFGETVDVVKEASDTKKEDLKKRLKAVKTDKDNYEPMLKCPVSGDDVTMAWCKSGECPDLESCPNKEAS